MSDTHELSGDLLIPPKGPAEVLSPQRAERLWDERASASSHDGFLWRRLDYEDPDAIAWINDRSGIDRIMAEALMAPDTQPRIHAEEQGLLVILRGVNLNPRAEPDDTISIRIWIEAGRVISVARRNLRTTSQLVSGLEARGIGPRHPTALVAAIADGLVDRASDTTGSLDDEMDQIEESVIDGSGGPETREFADLRRRALVLRRYFAPLAGAMRRLATTSHPVLRDDARSGLAEAASTAERMVADLELIRERAAVLADEQHRALAEKSNRTTFALTVIAGVFLPPTLLTGLLGVNVGGIPLAESPGGFAAVVMILLAIIALEVAVMVRLGWIPPPGRSRREPPQNDARES